MATQVQNTPPLSPAIESLLARLRRRIRAYVWADGVAAAVLVLAGGFWISLAFDWLIEPPVALRVIVLLAAAGALVYVVVRQLLVRLFVKLENRNLALLLERKFSRFRDSLLTAVEMSEQPEHAAQFNPEMLARAHREALTQAGDVELGKIFNTAPLVRRISLAAALVAAALVFAVAAPSAVGTWARRSLLMSDELWPRSTRLSVDGFEKQPRIKIAKGSDWDLVVKAEAALGRTIPEIVEVRYSTAEGSRGRENMSRDGLINPGEAAFQPYTYKFKSVLAPLEFHVFGGDDRQGPYYIDVVDSPTISRMTLHCEYPPYMKREPREVPVAGVMQLPRGTRITIQAAANKSLVGVQIDDLIDENTPTTHQIDLLDSRGTPQNEFQYSLPPLDADKTLLFSLRDTDGIRSREAVRLTLSAVPDDPPLVNVQLKGIGTAITPGARLPAAGEIVDDYGLSKVWFDFQIDETPAQQRPLQSTAAIGQEKTAVDDVMEVGDLALQPKQKLHWAIQAADTCALEGGPNVGSSQRYVLDVVTPEQLRAMLEGRELQLRRRFEILITELTETRDLLAGVELGGAKPADAPAAKDDKAAPAAKPEDATKPAASTPESESLTKIERVVQNCLRNGHDTLQVADAFDEIREEMINNRVDTEELKTRLKDGIADPLKKIVNERYAKLDEKLKQLIAQVADPQVSVATQKAAVAEMDAILVQMKQVLDKMLELETFNEVLDMLRQIIDAQEKVNEETKQQQKKKLRDLID